MGFASTNSFIMRSATYYASVLLVIFFKTVNAKECHYIYENGDMKYFHCNIYEYCCGTMCCRSPAITFYQMWYFWLMVFLTLLFCSGGGWWYRLRNQGPFMPPSMMSYAATRPNVDTMYTRNQMYPSPVPVVNAPQAQIIHQQPPPPPYYGPPPSYDTAMNHSRQG
ncbi:vesicular, overexpressed in cancer, prosurvival protein 1-like [Uloborus diversus]|uniref:vesicular, overexpressed in cancer, prosurvival protein 1-like n=1 Tax=Uloborus diversus TaxID=327109 RepID=UPI002408F4D0|nr:vesicular, overexpressed in cancer, prosurvival protein 1-like [Uloborus diversus]